jgi:hypothetical protein
MLDQTWTQSSPERSSRFVSTGRFIRAAERLNVGQTTVSARIRTIEQQLGRRLFVRNKGEASLAGLRTASTARDVPSSGADPPRSIHAAGAGTAFRARERGLVGVSRQDDGGGHDDRVSRPRTEASSRQRRKTSPHSMSCFMASDAGIERNDPVEPRRHR